jgi:hypothetical protein
MPTTVRADPIRSDPIRFGRRGGAAVGRRHDCFGSDPDVPRQGLTGFTFLSTPFTRTVTFPRFRARSATIR